MGISLVNGWYLFTSPELYCTRNCHVKHTRSKCLSNTVQFQHECITNPSITHADKVMRALADCVKAIHGMTGKNRTSPVTLDLQRIVDATQAHIQVQPERFEHAATPTDNTRGQQVPRVQVQTTADVPLPHTEITRSKTRTMSLLQPVQRVPSPAETTIKTLALPTQPTSRARAPKRRTSCL